MNKLQSLVLAITLLVGSVSVATAQDFDKGLAAYSAGDYQTALREWRPLAEQGDGQAQLYLGAMHLHGKGVLQDYAEGVRLYRLSAKQLVVAQFFLGVIYQDGEGVLQDNMLAHMWYNIASANGSSTGGLRDQLAEGMTQADISKAQEMARECMSSNYQNCGW